MGKKKINELASIPAGYSLTGNDLVAGWHTATSKTIKIPLSLLRIFVLSGGEAIPMPPVVNGDNLIIQVTEVEEGTNRVDVPALANKQFILRRRGSGALIPDVEYQALSSGGFILLKAGDVLQNEEIFEAQIYSLAVNPGSIGGSVGALITGVVPVSVNATLAASHAFKLIQLRAGMGNTLNITLPSLSEVPLYSIWPFEALIGNNRQHTIRTQGGQFIYFAGTSYGGLKIGVSESLWLMAGADGWYPISFTGNFFSIGEINAKYAAGLNELKCDGSLVSRTEYPRLWEFAQTLGNSLVFDSVWVTSAVTAGDGRSVPYPYIGCFSYGSGGLTGGDFRLPDLRNSALRGLKSAGGYSPLSSSSDTQRINNIPGDHQDDILRSHVHSIKAKAVGESGSGGLVGGTPGGITDATVDSEAAGGVETRMTNVGVHWYIKC